MPAVLKKPIYTLTSTSIDQVRDHAGAKSHPQV